jgi:hypothetical protein
MDNPVPREYVRKHPEAGFNDDHREKQSFNLCGRASGVIDHPSLSLSCTE